MPSELGKKIMECLLLNDDVVSGARISASCSASINTIRKELPVLNEELMPHGCQIISQASHGYCLIIRDQHKANAWLTSLLREIKRFSYLNLEEYARAYYLLRYLFSTLEIITMDQLADTMYCSKSTLIREISRMQTILGHFHLELKNTRSTGITIEGTEFNKRMCLLYLEKTHRTLPREQRGQEEDFCNSLLLNRDPSIFENCHRILLRNLAAQKSIDLPFIYVPKIVNYVLFAASRSHLATQISFTREQIAMASCDNVLPFVISLYKDLPSLVKARHTPQDELTLAMIIQTYRILHTPADLPAEIYARLYGEAEDALDFIAISYDVSASYDQQLHQQLALYMFNIECSRLYGIPFDQEISVPVSHMGVLCSDLCAEFGKFYDLRHHVKLSESAVMGLYYLFNRCLYENDRPVFTIRCLVASIYGLPFAEAIAAHFRKYYSRFIDRIDCISFISYDSMPSQQDDGKPYDAIFCDALDTRIAKETPVVPLTHIHAAQNDAQFRSFMNRFMLEKSLVFFPETHFSYCSCQTKEELFAQICSILGSQAVNQSDFMKDLAMKDYYVNCERNNGIVVISSFNYTMENPLIYMFVNRTPFVWNELPCRLAVYYSYGNASKEHIQVISYLLKKLIHSTLNQLDDALEKGYSGLISYLLNSPLQ